MLITYKNVIAKLELEYPQYDWSAMEGRVKGLVAEATRRSSTNQMKTVQQEAVPIDVVNGVAELPQDCYEWLIAFNEKGEELDCHQESNLLKPAKIHNGEIFIFYKALPIDEEGQPIILEQQFDYCFYYTVTSVMREDHIAGKVSTAVWQELTTERDLAFKSATQVKLSTQKKDKLVRLAKTARYYSINPKRF